jgi:hypothetical protein
MRVGWRPCSRRLTPWPDFVLRRRSDPYAHQIPHEGVPTACRTFVSGIPTQSEPANPVREAAGDCVYRAGRSIPASIARNQCCSSEYKQNGIAGDDARSIHERRQQCDAASVRYPVCPASRVDADGNAVRADGAAPVRHVQGACHDHECVTCSSCGAGGKCGPRCYTAPELFKAVHTAPAISRASSGGTALPTWVYPVVRLPQK